MRRWNGTPTATTTAIQAMAWFLIGTVIVWSFDDFENYFNGEHYSGVGAVFFVIYIFIFLLIAFYNFVSKAIKCSFFASMIYFSIYILAILFYQSRYDIFQLDMKLKEYAVVYAPWLCDSSTDIANHTAIVCYVYRDDWGQRAIVINPSDEMSKPSSEWSRKLLVDLEGPNGIIYPQNPAIADSRSFETEAFSKTRHVSQHVYFVDDHP
jgi:hypothetical protein